MIQMDSDRDSYSPNTGNRRRGRDRDRDRRRSRSPQRSYRDEYPSNSVRISDLSSSITERDLRHFLEDKGIPFSAVRLVRDRKTGNSRGVAFVDFYSVDDAKLLVEDDGESTIRGYTVCINYCSNRDNESDHRSDHSRETNTWENDGPTNTIMLRGIPSSFSEKDIRDVLEQQGIRYTDVRNIRDKRSGQSRGFGFVEFESSEGARQWMEAQQGILRVQDHNLRMVYSVPRDTGAGPRFGGGLLDVGLGAADMYSGGRSLLNDRPGLLQSDVLHIGDWNCATCGVYNFKRRDFCFKCNTSRLNSLVLADSTDGSDHVGSTPCNTLILRNLDALTTEENISLAFRAAHRMLPKHVQVIRDELTNVSHCYALVELTSAAEASHFMEQYPPGRAIFEIDGKAITINYAKNTFSTVLATIDHHTRQRRIITAQHQQQQTQLQLQQQASYAPNIVQPIYHQGVSGTGYATDNSTANMAAAVAQAALQQKQAQQQLAAAIVNSLHQGIANTNSSTGAHRHQPHKTHLDDQQSVTQMQHAFRQHQLQQKKQEEAQQHTSTASQPKVETKLFDAATATYTTYPTPDTSKFVYEETSGFYYDATTGLYYDSNSTYFYDQHTQTYFYWNQERSQYLPASSLTASTATSAEETNNQIDATIVKDKEKDKKEKAKTAMKIAKEMQKWAKQQNSQKSSSGFAIPAPPPTKDPVNSQMENASKTAEIGFAMLEAASSSHPTPPPLPASSAPASSGLVAQYGGDDSDNEEEDIYGDIDSGSALDPESRLAEEEEKLLNWDKKACLLCSRGFKDNETLQKHRSLSDLHKKNLEALRVRLGLPSATGLYHGNNGSGSSRGSSQQQHNFDSSPKHQYRDRAKERRDKFGLPSPPRSSKYRRGGGSAQEKEDRSPLRSSGSHEMTMTSPPVVPEPTGEANVGSRLMQKMGWQSGQGLGRANQGRTQLVEPEFRPQGVGLGAAKSNSKAPNLGENYKDNVKKAMFARYHDME